MAPLIIHLFWSTVVWLFTIFVVYIQNIYVRLMLLYRVYCFCFLLRTFQQNTILCMCNIIMKRNLHNY